VKGSEMDISVVLATYNRAASLQLTLDSFSKLRIPPTLRWELLVVDNNSNDDTAAVIRSFIQRIGPQVRYIFEATQGRSAALNAGIARALGDVVAFTDDDVILDPDWLAQLHQAFHDRSVTAVAGRILPLWQHPRPDWLELDGQQAVVNFDLGDRPQDIRIAPMGANSAFRKEVFANYGLFRLDLGVRGSQHTITCDDTEFGGRLMAADERILYWPTAIIHHPVDPQRTTKKYFLSWYYYNGVSLTRTEGLPNIGVFYFGVPRWFYRQLLADMARWFVTVNPKRRFLCKLQTCRTIGSIVESHRLSRRKSKLLEFPARPQSGNAPI
jgi:glycosyltransferase involved in cell wall biosynthesis